MDFFKNVYRSVFGSLVALAITGLLAGCSGSDDNNNGAGGGGGSPGGGGTTVEELTFAGEDTKEAFLKQYSGFEYKIPNHRGTLEGLTAGNETLYVEQNGDYILTIDGTTEIKTADNRTVRCTGITERGTIETVRTVAGEGGLLQMGRHHLKGDGVGGVIILKPGVDGTTVNSAELVVDQEAEQQAEAAREAAKEDQNVAERAAEEVEKTVEDIGEKIEQTVQGQTGTDDDIDPQLEANKACARTDDRVLVVESFLPQAILLSATQLDKTEEQPSTEDALNVQNQGEPALFFLEQRLIVRNGTRWVWLTDDLAKKAVSESSGIIQAGFHGLEVLGNNIDELEEAEGSRNATGMVNMEEGSNRMTLEFGTSALTTPLPLLRITGDLWGVSYNVDDGALSYNLVNFETSALDIQLQGIGLTPEIAEDIREAREEIAPEVRKLTDPNLQKYHVLTVTLNTRERERERVKIHTKEGGPIDTAALDAIVKPEEPAQSQQPGQQPEPPAKPQSQAQPPVGTRPT